VGGSRKERVGQNNHVSVREKDRLNWKEKRGDWGGSTKTTEPGGVAQPERADRKIPILERGRQSTRSQRDDVCNSTEERREAVCKAEAQASERGGLQRGERP